MIDYQDRVLIEQILIADILTDPMAYMKVANILSATNFSVPLYSTIYKACTEIYPNEISPISVFQKTNISIKELLIDHPGNSRISYSIYNNALVLVECSMYDVFLHLMLKLQKENTDYSKNEDFEVMLNNIRMDGDILKTVVIIKDYFQRNKGFEIEREAVNNFYDNFLKKVNHIKEQKHIGDLFSKLDNLYSLDYGKKQLLNSLSQITKFVLSNNVDRALASDIISLSLKLNN